MTSVFFTYVPRLKRTSQHHFLSKYFTLQHHVLRAWLLYHKTAIGRDYIKFRSFLYSRRIVGYLIHSNCSFLSICFLITFDCSTMTKFSSSTCISLFVFCLLLPLQLVLVVKGQVRRYYFWLAFPKMRRSFHFIWFRFVSFQQNNNRN